jgi:hypothetical protein
MTAARRITSTLLIAVCTGALAACGDDATGVIVAVRFDPVAHATAQIQFTVLGPDHATPLVPATMRPAAPAGPLGSPQTLLVLLPAIAETVFCQAALASAPDVQGERSVAVVPGQIARVEIPLDATPLGGACATDAGCASGHCADGVCCAEACNARCVACNLPTSPGRCVPVAAGAVDPKGICAASPAGGCGATGACDGAGACSLQLAGAPCAPTCSAFGQSTDGRTCDGLGSCGGGKAKTCLQNLACDPSTGACFAACSADAMCTTSCDLSQSPPRCRTH